MKVLVIGANGQLGKDLIRVLGEQFNVQGYTRHDMDITRLEQCREMICKVRPDAIIHAAAYTAVDLAESERDAAFKVNAVGSRNVAVAAQEVGAKLCYISTDYVFDGKVSQPYNEYDRTGPESIYGKSKLAGEHMVQTLTHKYFIVRTSWLYGHHGNKFVKTMLKLGKEKEQLNVVYDQVGSPTYSIDLCRFLENLIQTDKYGIYHATNTGTCSWLQFAEAIFEESGLTVQVHPCSTEQFRRPAPRPAFSVLDHMSIRTNDFKDLRHWRATLKDFLVEWRGGELDNFFGI
jgi:dTDP-4-dehydrorhamnose reductase